MYTYYVVVNAEIKHNYVGQNIFEQVMDMEITSHDEP